jgi:hypothetical protein
MKHASGDDAGEKICWCRLVQIVPALTEAGGAAAGQSFARECNICTVRSCILLMVSFKDVTVSFVATPHRCPVANGALQARF